MSARARNVGHAPIDTLNMTFVVDGVIKPGFVAEIGGAETGTWHPQEYAYLNGSSTVEPERVVALTPLGTMMHFEHVICPVLSRIVVTPSSASMDIGETQEFSAVGYDQYGDSFDGRPYSWSSTCGSTSLVDSNSADLTAGTVAGPCLVTATSGIISGSATVVIDPDPPVSITVEPDGVGVAAGSTQTFTSTALDQYGNVNTTAPITWTTDGGSISDAGVLTAQTVAQLGRTVTATWTTLSGSATVDVHPAAPATAVLTPDGAGVTAGGTQAYSVTLYDAYGNVNSTAAVTWTTNAGSISSDGILTAQTTAATGRSVTATSGAASATVTVDIIADAPASIVVTPEAAGIPAGSTLAYAAAVYDQHGNLNTTAPVTWSTDGGAIDAAGLLTAQTTAATGRTVTATSGAASDSTTVDIWPAAPATALVTPDGAGVTVAGTQAYAVTLYDAYGNVNSTAPVTWTTDAGTISADGVLTAQTTAATGRTVTATSGAATDSATVDVIAGAPASALVTPDGAGVTVGTTRTYSAVVYDAYGNVNGTASVTWSTNAGTISAGGVLTAQTTAATGRTVTATSGAATDSATVDLIADTPTSIQVAPDGVGVPAGGTRDFGATAFDQYGNVNASASAAVTWSTNAGSISSAGRLTAQTSPATGLTVTATVSGVSGSATVDIYPAAPSSVTLSPTSAIVNTTLTRQFTATVRDAYGNLNTTAPVTWSATRGSVDATGLYTAPSTTGADTVTATSGSASGSASITVQKTILVQSLTTYKNNVTSSTFAKGSDTVEARGVVIDHLGNVVSGVSVTLEWVKPNGQIQRTDTLTTNTSGVSRAYLSLPNGSPGEWSARITQLSGTDLWWSSSSDTAARTVLFQVS